MKTNLDELYILLDKIKERFLRSRIPTQYEKRIVSSISPIIVLDGRIKNYAGEADWVNDEIPKIRLSRHWLENPRYEKDTEHTLAHEFAHLADYVCREGWDNILEHGDYHDPYFNRLNRAFGGDWKYWKE